MSIKALSANKKARTLHVRKEDRIKAIALHTVLIILAVIMLMPLVWMLATALSPNSTRPPTSLIPTNLTFNNFIEGWDYPSKVQVGTTATMGTFIMNSAITTVAIVIFGILFDSLAAYVLAFKEFPGKNLCVFLALATLMIPSYITLVPQFLIIADWGWMNTYWALIIPFLGSGMGISLFRSSFLSISKELVESAKIDGASDLRIYTTITLPLAKSTIATMTILKGMWSWNQYLWPLIVCNKTEMMTIQVALDLFKGRAVNEWGYLCAGMVIAILPLLLVFLFCQKFFIGGVQAGAVKG